MSGDNGWRPIANGEFYCSPRCGGGKFCRREWYDAAVRSADALAARMGDGWKANVYENLGWHYDVAKAGARITVNEVRHKPFDPETNYPVRSYTAWINVHATVGSHSSGDGTAVQFIVTASDPDDALGMATHDARNCIARIEQSLADISA